MKFKKHTKEKRKKLSEKIIRQLAEIYFHPVLSWNMHHVILLPSAWTLLDTSVKNDQVVRNPRPLIAQTHLLIVAILLLLGSRTKPFAVHSPTAPTETFPVTFYLYCVITWSLRAIAARPSGSKPGKYQGTFELLLRTEQDNLWVQEPSYNSIGWMVACNIEWRSCRSQRIRDFPSFIIIFYVSFVYPQLIISHVLAHDLMYACSSITWDIDY